MIHASPKSAPACRYVIVGCGPAGLALAHTLADRKNCLILEAGGPLKATKKPEATTQTWDTNYIGNLGQHPIAGFGGALQTGGTRWMPLQPVDFLQKPKSQISGWPISYAEYTKWITPAYEFLVPRYVRGNDFLFDKEKPSWETNPQGFLRGTLPQVNWSIEELQNRIEKSPQAHLVFHSKVVGVVTNGTTITHVVVESKDGKHNIPCKNLILAGGAIQNAKMLLEWEQTKSLVTEGSDWVGRCFMDQPFLEMHHWSRDLQNRILDGQWIAPTQELWGKTKNRSFIFRIPDYNFRGKTPQGTGTTILDMMFGPGKIHQCEIWAEQNPNRNNRVTLNGKNPHIRCQLDKTDLNAYQAIGREIACIAARLGERIQIRNNIWQSNYHTGTTRMAHDAKNGVCNINCKVFGTDNLFIAGGSIFPSSGAAPPGLSIIALAIRLGDHLLKKI